MKATNAKFFASVTAVLLISSLLLMGGMYVIASDYGDAREYDMGSQIGTGSSISSDNEPPIGDNIIIEDDAPTAQTDLQKKFSAMYDISKDGKTITVISEEYLYNYWQSNYEKEVIHSLSTEEVYFIIQDSIRIYMQYDRVILPEFTSASSVSQVAERFPFLSSAELFSLLWISSLSSERREKIESDIHTIILYRLKALSSPKAFFTGAEAILFVGDEPALYSSMLPETHFYIPGYSANTDRDYILSVIGGSTDFTDLERFTDLFEVACWESINIRFSSVSNGTTTDVFPTDDIYKVPVPDGYTVVNKPDSEKESDTVEKQETTHYFKLDITGGSCSLMTSDGKTEAEGAYTQESDAHILWFDGDFRYVFYYNEYVGYEYSKGESNPIPGYEFEGDIVFSLNDNLLKPTEK